VLTTATLSLFQSPALCVRMGCEGSKASQERDAETFPSQTSLDSTAESLDVDSMKHLHIVEARAFKTLLESAAHERAPVRTEKQDTIRMPSQEEEQEVPVDAPKYLDMMAALALESLLESAAHEIAPVSAEEQDAIRTSSREDDTKVPIEAPKTFVPEASLDSITQSMDVDSMKLLELADHEMAPVRAEQQGAIRSTSQDRSGQMIQRPYWIMRLDTVQEEQEAPVDATVLDLTTQPMDVDSLKRLYIEEELAFKNLLKSAAHRMAPVRAETTPHQADESFVVAI